MQTIRLVLLCSFFFVGLLWPSSPGSLLRVEDAILSVLVVLCIPVGMRNELHRRYLVFTVGFVVFFLMVGMAAVVLVSPPFGFSSGTVSTVKEAGRMVKVGLLCYASLAVLRLVTARQRTALALVFALLLGIHLAVGIAQYAQVPAVVELTHEYFVDEVQAGNLTEGAIASRSFRAVGTVYNPNIFGFIGVTLGFVIRGLVPGKRWLLVLASAAAAATVVLSQSRSAIIAGLMGIAWLGVASAKSRRGVFDRLLTLGVVMAALLAGQSFFAEGRLGGEGVTLFASRPQYAWLFDEVLGGSPLVGFGIGTVWFLPSDSDYLFALIQTGLLGVLALVTYYYLLFFGPGREMPGLRAAVIVAAVGGVANGVFFGNEVVPFVYLMFAAAITEIHVGAKLHERSGANPHSPRGALAGGRQSSRAIGQRGRSSAPCRAPSIESSDSAT